MLNIKYDDVITTSDDKDLEGGKTRMRRIYQSVLIWWKLNHPPKSWPIQEILTYGFVCDIFVMNWTSQHSRSILFTCQNLGLQIFELDMPLFLPLCPILQNSLEEFNFERQLRLLIPEGLDLVFSDFFVMRHWWKI